MQGMSNHSAQWLFHEPRMQRFIEYNGLGLLADERERRALSLHSTARSIVFMGYSSLQPRLAALWL
jgi:hypothetical protein